ncbi:MAG: ATP-binding protein, partial [Planctomycetota bacterium]
MHNLVAVLVALHAGKGERFRVTLARALRRGDQLLDRESAILGLVFPLARPPLEPSGASRIPGDIRTSAEPAERLALRLRIWMQRRRERPERARSLPRAIWNPDRSQVIPPAGSHGRLVVENLLAAATLQPSDEVVGALERLESYLAKNETSRLQCRVLGALAAVRQSEKEIKAAGEFSRAVALFEEGTAGRYRVHDGAPDELTRAARRFRSARDEAADADSLHATAHRALLRHGNTSAPDQRLASALRRVLEVSAQMRSEGGLESLLESMTRHTIEITGAQRACVVLLEEDSGLQIRVSTSASDQQQRVDIRDLSHTVIRRVIVSKKPLLLHDIFDDEELMGRPSIANLSLRSILCVPMLRGGNLYGVMYADSTSAAAAFDRVDLEVLSLFAEQGAAALETSRLVEDVQSSYAELKSVQDRLVRGERLRVIGELSSGVAHEFNNLLTAILARIQMMSLNYLSPDLRKDLDLIEKAALDAAEVVRRLQTFSRQQRQADFTTLDMSEVCADAVDLLRPLWRGRRRGPRGPINVQIRTEPGLYVRGDPTELREVLTNVIKNAVDAVGKSGRITVSAARRQGLIRIRIEDDGPGISQENLTKVFDPFFTTKGERGTGLGLCLSQQIVERHGGSIRVDSEPGRGTTITFTLRATERPSPVGEGATEPEAPAADALKVVVVDDDAEVLRPLCSYLEKSGYEVISAADGAEGLQVTKAHEPDVVLTDIGMPGMDGIELCRQIQEMNPRVPIVLMSGWASDVDP